MNHLGVRPTLGSIILFKLLGEEPKAEHWLGEEILHRLGPDSSHIHFPSRNEQKK